MGALTRYVIAALATCGVSASLVAAPFYSFGAEAGGSSVGSAPANENKTGATIYIASDSTAADYGPEKLPQMGWGMVLKCSLDKTLKVVNFAQPGRSARTFRSDGWMAKIDAAIQPGDVLLVQFGHNDSAKNLPDRYTPIPDFKHELTGYVELARRNQAQPILITPLSTAIFGWDTLFNSLGEYAQAVREVAASTGTPLIDLNADTQAALLAVGPTASHRWYMPDTRHLYEGGARMAASMVALRLSGLGLPVSKHVRISLTADAAILGRPDCPTRPQGASGGISL